MGSDLRQECGASVHPRDRIYTEHTILNVNNYSGLARAYNSCRKVPVLQSILLSNSLEPLMLCLWLCKGLSLQKGGRTSEVDDHAMRAYRPVRPFARELKAVQKGDRAVQVGQLARCDGREPPVVQSATSHDTYLSATVLLVLVARFDPRMRIATSSKSELQ